ncbi:hypothetical protein [Streptomyces sp. NPDC127108]|uniref:hypothetical protein n=1 Tax=Streptomyces sp. NPDC127108 TaxID=3345361 RepID=UPI00363A3B9C
MAWLKQHAKVSKLNPNTSETIAHAAEKFHKKVPDWNPNESAFRRTAESKMCYAEAPERGFSAQFALAYRAAARPFEEIATHDSFISVDLGPDAKLVYQKNRYVDQRSYNIYIRCGVRGAPASQLNDVLLEGSMTDLLTDDLSSYRPHLQHLLHSAKVMADGFKCTNNPQIPTALPSSVKD